MSCDPEQVTGYVDDALAPEARMTIEAHLADCATCQQQATEERTLRDRLRRLPEAPLRRGFENEVRGRLHAETRFRKRRILLPLAASLAVIGLWARGSAPVVAWEVARDHRHCFGAKELPAKVWSNDPAEIQAWFEKQGTPMPTLPASAGSVELVGARYCPLPDATMVAHTYYGSRKRRVSLYVVPRSLRFASSFAKVSGDQTVRLIRVAGQTIALVSEEPGEVEAFERVFRTTVAGVDAAPTAWANLTRGNAVAPRGLTLLSLASPSHVFESPHVDRHALLLLD